MRLDIKLGPLNINITNEPPPTAPAPIDKHQLWEQWTAQHKTVGTTGSDITFGFTHPNVEYPKDRWEPQT